MRGGPGRTIADSATDDFNRASLGANWTKNTGTSDTIASADWGIITSGNIAIASWAGAPTPGPDQFCEATLAAGWSPSGFLLAAINVRRRNSDGARYMFGYSNDPNDSDPTVEWVIKYDGLASEFTRILVGNPSPGAPAAGDRLRFEVRGTGASVNLKGYRNGTLICEANDTNNGTPTPEVTRILAGSPGLVCRVWVGETITYPKAAFTDFATGTLL